MDSLCVTRLVLRERWQAGPQGPREPDSRGMLSPGPDLWLMSGL